MTCFLSCKIHKFCPGGMEALFIHKYLKTVSCKWSQVCNGVAIFKVTDLGALCKHRPIIVGKC